MSELPRSVSDAESRVRARTIAATAPPYERLGKALAAAGRKPAALQTIVDDVVRLAAGQAAEDAVTVFEEQRA